MSNYEIATLLLGVSGVVATVAIYINKEFKSLRTFFIATIDKVEDKIDKKFDKVDNKIDLLRAEQIKHQATTHSRLNIVEQKVS